MHLNFSSKVPFQIVLCGFRFQIILVRVTFTFSSFLPSLHCSSAMDLDTYDAIGHYKNTGAYPRSIAEMDDKVERRSKKLEAELQEEV